MASPTTSPDGVVVVGVDAHNETAFDMQWQPTDTTSLQPSHLELSRVPRAWERRPLSPYSRQKMRVGKVWKRQAPVEIRRTAGFGGGRPVKKMRLLSGPSVARWDGDGDGHDDVSGSPARKIVTRSQRVGEEEMRELRQEECDVQRQQKGEDGLVVKVFAEDGGVLDVHPAEVEGQEEWEDEDVGDEGEEFNPTMMHLGELMEKAEAQSVGARHERPDEQVLSHPALAADGETAGLENAGEGETLYAADEQGPPNDENVAPQQDSQPSASNAPQDVALPDGFVSPVKRGACAERRTARASSLGSRRRTLPKEWRPSLLKQVLTTEGVRAYERATAIAAAAASRDVAHEVDNAPVLLHEEAVATEEVNWAPPGQAGSESDWEDVNDGFEAHTDAARDGEFEDPVVNDTSLDDAAIDSPDTTANWAGDDADQDMDDLPASTLETEKFMPLTNVPSSPVPTIDGQHPLLPLRRSPRRKTCSPVKQTSIQPPTATSHLVVLTPLKGLQVPPRISMSSSSLLEETAEGDSTENTTPRLERSVSAPAEEPQTSLTRPSRPRISDDTALLQAFLNRAAETKSSARRISTSKRESITNRRDSDAVRQALASPAKAEVLAEMDPNSPSPRKVPASQDEADDVDALPEPESSPLRKTRRSSRATRKAAPQTATPAAAPNKISIRGNSDGVVLKKSEAQELSQVTRTNTRKNKGGAVLPLYRLSKMQQQDITDPLDDECVEGEVGAPKPNSKGRTLRWTETLVEFYQGGEVSETSLLSDELSTAVPALSTGENMEVDNEDPVSAPPPPAETPSKPKIRRLKAPRTAAAPGQAGPAVAAPGEAEEAIPQESSASQSKAPAPTKRRSRIATPAKGLSNASLLPTDLEPTGPAPTQQPKKSLPTATVTTARRKAAVSKLPAPAPTSSAVVGQGKENVIASPAKKKTAPALPAVKNFAPKLDFGKGAAASFPASVSSSQQQDAVSMPGLASPAKKGARRAFVADEPEGKEEVLPPGLRSPAKKRTRRAGGGV